MQVSTEEGKNLRSDMSFVFDPPALIAYPVFILATDLPVRNFLFCIGWISHEP